MSDTAPEPDWILEVRQWLQDRDNDHAAAVSAADNAALREQVQALQSEVIRATNFELDAGRVMRHEPMLNGFEDLWAIEAEFDALRERVKVLEDALRKLLFMGEDAPSTLEDYAEASEAARAALEQKP